MGKKAKSKEKKKNAIFKSKYVSAKNKAAKDKPDATEQGTKKGTKKQAKALKLEQEYKALARKYQGIEDQAARMLENISRLQLESREVKDSLALETENTALVRDRLGSLETGKEADQESLTALKLQAEQQAGLVSEARNRLETVERLANQGASLREQIEYLKAGKSEMETSIGKLVKEENVLKSDNQGLGSRVESLSSSFDEAIRRMEESAGRHQVIETWMENLSRAESDLTLQMGQQQERVQGLVDRSEKLDQAAHEVMASYRALQEEVRSLSRDLIAAQEQIAGKGAELEKRSRVLESEVQQLATRHDRFAATVFVGGLLLLILFGAVYWAKIGHLDDTTAVTAQQIEDISAQVAQHESMLAYQEQQITASSEMLAGSRGPASGETDDRLDSLSKSYEAMDEKLQGVAERQQELTIKYVQLGEDQLAMGGQLERAQGMLIELSGERKPPASKDRVKGSQTESGVKTAQYSADKDEDRARLLGLNPRHYTIQIFAAYDADVVSRVAAREDLPGTMAIYKGVFNQRDWYVLLHGEYSTIKEARSAIQGLPKDIRAGGPWVRKLSSIHSDLAQ